ncbi:hypothetical protein GW17_00049404 [Ensete ventricosum]|nr:hypothetical protein GW17_00049404 [Ensete ventricosum]
MGGPDPLYEEVASEQFASLLQAPFGPSLGVAAPHIESSTEKGPNLPLSLIGQGPCVDSSDPSLGPCAMTPPREEVANEPFAPCGEGDLEDLLVIPPPSYDNASASWGPFASGPSAIATSRHMTSSPSAPLRLRWMG